MQPRSAESDRVILAQYHNKHYSQPPERCVLEAWHLLSVLMVVEGLQVLLVGSGSAAVAEECMDEEYWSCRNIERLGFDG